MVDTIYEVTNSTMLGTIQFCNVMHIRDGSGTVQTTANVQLAIDKIASSYYNFFTSYSPSGARWQAGTKVVRFDTSAPAVKTFVPTTPTLTAGTGTGSSLPGQLAVCVDWLTAIPGRSYRGRSFYGPLNSTSLSGPVLSPTALGSFNSAPNGLVAGLIALTPSWHLVVWSKLHSTWEAVTSGYTDGVVDSLRSRKY